MQKRPPLGPVQTACDLRPSKTGCLRALWERLAAAGKLPQDIDISDPNAVDWERIADVLLAMEAFQEWVVRLSELPEDGLWCRDETGQFVEIPVPTAERLVH